MSTWSPDRLARISGTDDLHIERFRPDGTIRGTLTWIWSVVVDDRLFVGPWHGRRRLPLISGRDQPKGGPITAAGDTFAVAADETLNDAVDDAYRAKYAGSAYLPPMITTGPRSATVEIAVTAGGTGSGASSHAS